LTRDSAKLEMRRLRVGDDKLRSLLDTMDTSAGGDSSGRTSERYRYRASHVLLELSAETGAPMRIAVTTRNVSQGGVGLLSGQFLYPGTRCRVHLISTQNHVRPIPGVVARCRYEVGVRFDEPVDVSLFHRGATRVHVLYADPSSLMHELAGRLLRGINHELVCVGDGRAAVEKARQAAFGLVLVELELPELDGAGVARELRSGGYLGTLVAVSTAEQAAKADECREAGFDDYVQKPLERRRLHELAAAQMDEPVISSMSGERDMAEGLDLYVTELGQLAQTIETAFATDDADALRQVTRTLRGEAGGFGFEIVAQAAAELDAALGADASPGGRRQATRRLVRVCRAARSATPSS
jgi:CheY-like chemotaxis protein